MVLGGYLLLVLAYCLPTGEIADNVAEAALAMSARLPASSLLSTVHAHPTLSEALTAALRALR